MRVRVETSLGVPLSAAGFDPNQPRDEEGQWTEHPGDLNIKVLTDLPNTTDGTDIQLTLPPSNSSAKTINPADFGSVLNELDAIAPGELGTAVQKIRSNQDLTSAEAAAFVKYLDSELGAEGLLSLKHLVEDNLMDNSEAKQLRSQASKLRTKLKKI
jgi:hypothetical protein